MTAVSAAEDLRHAIVSAFCLASQQRMIAPSLEVMMAASLKFSARMDFTIWMVYPMTMRTFVANLVCRPSAISSLRSGMESRFNRSAVFLAMPECEEQSDDRDGGEEYNAISNCDCDLSHALGVFGFDLLESWAGLGLLAG